MSRHRTSVSDDFAGPTDAGRITAYFNGYPGAIGGKMVLMGRPRNDSGKFRSAVETNQR
jgi:hypothetical protein